MIEVRNLNKSFDDKQVLKDISAVFENGKTNLIIGRSGSGKTVLMKSIIGLHQVDSGEILYDNRDLTKMRFKDIKELRKEVGMLFQGSALFDSLTVFEKRNIPFRDVFFDDKKRDDRPCKLLHQSRKPHRSKKQISFGNKWWYAKTSSNSSFHIAQSEIPFLRRAKFRT